MDNDMDLGALTMNGDFDSELFDIWDTAADQDQDNQRIVREDENVESQQGDGDDQQGTDYGNELTDAKLPANPLGWSGSCTGSAHSSSASRTQQLGVVSVSDAASSAGQSYQNLLPSFESQPHHSHQRSLDPRGIQSSANCPPHALVGGPVSNTVGASSFFHGAANIATPSLAQGKHELSQFDVTSAALLPMALNAIAAGVTLPLPLVLQATQQAMNPSVLQATASDMLQGLGLPSSASAGPAFGVAPLNSINTTAPSYMYDGPAELKANFLNAQQAAGLPLLSAANPFHFGVTVNGFHPQTNMMGALPPQMIAVAQHHGVVAAAHNPNGTKNAKEQRRAQKITVLIENLRLKMEKDGWQVGLNRSKLNTLSCCAGYVRHLVKLNQEKETTIQQTRCDLEAAQKKLLDKAQTDRSEPESTISSLTVSSGSATRQSEKRAQEDSSLSNSSCAVKKCDGKTYSMSLEDDHRVKRHRYHEPTVTAATTSSPSSTSASAPNCATVSGESMSDITDSNNELTSKSDSPSLDCVSSDATHASMRVVEPRSHSPDRSNKRRHHSRDETSSMQEGFELDYEEVFLKSNVPQFLASTDGRILAWNSFFLKATGFDAKTIQRATIFGLVRCSKLANLFEIVAKALRNKVQPIGNYLATTLPCVKFSACVDKQLYITVSFMPDDDPFKRCFHCVLTDTPPTMESPGPVTEELLIMLLSESGDARKPSSGKHGIKVVNDSMSTSSGKDEVKVVGDEALHSAEASALAMPEAAADENEDRAVAGQPRAVVLKPAPSTRRLRSSSKDQ